MALFVSSGFGEGHGHEFSHRDDLSTVSASVCSAESSAKESAKSAVRSCADGEHGHTSGQDLNCHVCNSCHHSISMIPSAGFKLPSLVLVERFSSVIDSYEHPFLKTPQEPPRA